jgi:hypothetical protein
MDHATEPPSFHVDDTRFDPFRRHDVGVLSSGYELLKTVLMVPLAPLRALFLVALLMWYAGMCKLASWGLPEGPGGLDTMWRTWWRRFALLMGHYAAKLALLGTLGMWVHVTPDSDFTCHNAQGVKAQVCLLRVVCVGVCNNVAFRYG